MFLFYTVICSDEFDSGDDREGTASTTSVPPTITLPTNREHSQNLMSVQATITETHPPTVTAIPPVIQGAMPSNTSTLSLVSSLYTSDDDSDDGQDLVASKSVTHTTRVPPTNPEPEPTDTLQPVNTESPPPAVVPSVSPVTTSKTANSLYAKLLKLPFPNPGTHALSVADKKTLLSDTLKRYVAVNKLVDKSLSGKRGNCRFDPELTSRYKWLFTGDEGSFCIVCKIFCTRLSMPRMKSKFTSFPFLGYSRKKSFLDHSNTAYHKEAEVKAQGFKSVVVAATPDIQVQVAGKTREFYMNKDRLHGIAKVILDLAKQGIALRGHRYETLREEEMQVSRINAQGEMIVLGDQNKGNFLHFVRARADAGDNRLRFRSMADRRAAYLSPNVQNELLLILSSQVRGKIVQCIGSDPFTIIADETTDAGTESALRSSSVFGDGSHRRVIPVIRRDPQHDR